MLGIDPHGIDDPVDANAAGEALDGFDRIFTIEVDGLCALALGHAQAIVVLVDGEHPTGAEQLCAGDGELAHRPAAEHRHGVAATDLGHLGAEVAGGKNVGQQDRLVIADLRRQLHQADVGEGNPRLFSLQPMKRASGLRAAVEGGAGFLAVGIGTVALGEVARPAVGTVAAGNGGWDDHPITDLQVTNIGTQFFDDADTLVAENSAGLHAAHGAAHEMQIGAAYGRCGDAHDGIGRRKDARFGYVFQADVADVVINHSFHSYSVSPARCGARSRRLSGGTDERAARQKKRTGAMLESQAPRGIRKIRVRTAK